MEEVAGHAHTIAAGSEKQRVDIGFQAWKNHELRDFAGFCIQLWDAMLTFLLLRPLLARGKVFNFSNYPLLSKLFDELGVETIQSDMSLSVAARGVTDTWRHPRWRVGRLIYLQIHTHSLLCVCVCVFICVRMRIGMVDGRKLEPAASSEQRA